MQRIAVLHHRDTTETMLRRSAISELSRVWEEDGLEVLHLAGVADAPAADVLIVHVDLSVVPDEYLAFAARYETVVNGRVKDIRKSTTNHHLVQLDDGWSGPVIVKSNLNCAGRGEHLTEKRYPSFPFPIRHQGDYRIYESADEVPKEYFGHPLLVRARAFAEKLCEPGSSELAFERRISAFRRVRHLKSRIEGRLAPGLDAIELLRRAHPPLKSYPDELAVGLAADPAAGGLYGGLLARSNARGDLTAFLNLRSVQRVGTRLVTRGGVGVVDGSTLRGEEREILAKLRSIDEAVLGWTSVDESSASPSLVRKGP